MLTDVSDLTRAGNAFQALAAATGKARSPSVERFVGGTSSVTVSVDRVCRLMLRLEVRRTDSVKYAGSPSWRQWCINTHSRKLFRSGTFSQCNWRSSPVTLSYLLAEQTSSRGIKNRLQATQLCRHRVTVTAEHHTATFGDAR